MELLLNLDVTDTESRLGP